MAIKNLREADITNNPAINSNFLSISRDKIKLNCKIYKGDFYSDSFNCFPITTDNLSFLELFMWGEKTKYQKFFTQDFDLSFDNNKKNFKTFDNVIVLGSSIANNYYRNLITFLPRIFFIPDKKINLAIHRKSSNNFRDFLESIIVSLGIKLNKFIYLDDNFFLFNNSQIPQFFSKNNSITILNQLLAKKDVNQKIKLYVTRKNASCRKIINESNLIDELKINNFQIVDTENMTINEQINIFSAAEIVISSTGSALANIVFCREGTKILEITPKYNFDYENVFKNRYSDICNQLKLKYYSLEADPIENELIKTNSEKFQFIDLNIINKSNYYKNLLVKVNEFKKLIDQF